MVVERRAVETVTANWNDELDTDDDISNDSSLFMTEHGVVIQGRTF